jgi:hypothetical protein
MAYTPEIGLEAPITILSFEKAVNGKTINEINRMKQSLNFKCFIFSPPSVRALRK